MEKKKILIVEDDPTILKLLRLQLEEAGYEVIYTLKSNEALDIAIAQNPDLITLDIMMEPLNGYQVIKLLKENEKTKCIPVIFVSVLEGNEDDETPEAEGFITKPFRKKELLALINNIFVSVAKKKA